MTRQIIFGTFNSEKYWRDDCYAKLPAFNDVEADRIVSVMDELLFVQCRSSEDLLVTRYPLENCFKDYLTGLGFNFKNIAALDKDMKYSTNGFYSKSISALLTQNNNHLLSNEFIDVDISPFSIIPDTYFFLSKYKIQKKIPAKKTVIDVNSKFFSHDLSNEFFDGSSILISDSKELKQNGLQLLKKSKFLIKDGFGVSGKGNLLIESEKILETICRYIFKQEKQGKKTCFVIEPVYNKKIDFSCQIEIMENSDISIRSIQEMKNSNFAFAGIKTADDELINLLKKQNYFKMVQFIGKKIYEKGYFGPVCIDSMILRNNNIIPIIEINARKSMGLLNHYLDDFLAQFNTKSEFQFSSFKTSRMFSIESFFNAMKDADILFSQDKPYGVLPLSTRTMLINIDQNTNTDKGAKGRFYFSLIGNEEIKSKSVDKMNQLFINFGCNIL